MGIKAVTRALQDLASQSLALDENRELLKQRLYTALVTTISDIDCLITRQVNVIIHHSRFQQLEASWRGVRYLTNSKQRDGGVKVKLMHCSWQELSKDCARSMEFDQSAIFKWLYSNEFGRAGGEPFGLVVGDYYLGHQQNGVNYDASIATLKKITGAAASAFSPFVMAASPEFLGCDRFSELAAVSNLSSQFNQYNYRTWWSLRQLEDARFLGLVLPSVLMRQTYCKDGKRQDPFPFSETTEKGEQDLLWGNGAYCFAATVIRSFDEYGWFTHIRGQEPGELSRGIIQGPTEICVPLLGQQVQPRSPVAVRVSEKKEKELADLGFIPILSVPHSSNLGLFSNASVHTPKAYDSDHANANAKLSSMLQYILCVSRVAHYLKTIGREKIGAFVDQDELEYELQSWINHYTMSADQATEEMRARYPLKSAQVKIKQKPGHQGKYYTVMHLQPHFQIDQMVSSLKLVTELSANIEEK